MPATEDIFSAAEKWPMSYTRQSAKSQNETYRRRQLASPPGGASGAAFVTHARLMTAWDPRVPTEYLSQ